MMAKTDLKSPALYINRELSWLEFNDRVLQEGLSADLPLLERLKFLAIVSSNLDEAFMIRVAGLMQQRSAGLRRRDAAGMTPSQQLDAFSERAHRMVDEQTAGIHAALAELAGHGLHVLEPGDWTATQEEFLEAHFSNEVLPVLTPLAVQELDPCPLLPGLHLYVAAVLAPQDEDKDEGEGKGEGKGEEQIIVVPVPAPFSRLVDLPSDEDVRLARGVRLARLEDVIARYVGMLFPEREVLVTVVFRITRDADVEIDDDEAGDLLHVVEEAVLARRRRAAVRLELTAHSDRRLKRWLMQWLDVRTEDVYEIDGMLDATALMGRRETCSGAKTSGRPCKTTTCCCSTRTRASIRSCSWSSRRPKTRKC
jgi:polyphosphate kinase